MPHEGIDLGETLHHHGILPVQLEKDANVVESFMPAAFVEEIDAIEDAWDDATVPTKKQKVSQNKKGKPTKAKGEYSGTMRRRQPTKYTKLAKKVNTIKCCVDTETHMVDTDCVNASHATNTLYTLSLLTLAQGDTIITRTGNKIAVRGVAFSLNFATITGPVEVFLVRPSNTNTAPVASDFTPTTGPGKMIVAGKGWVIRKYTVDPTLKKSLDIFVPVRLNTIYQTGSNNPASNNLYLCISNDTGATIQYTGIARCFFKG